ncbi:MAG: hypothetical protein ACJ74G_24120 [Blastocatellia bacterium]
MNRNSEEQKIKRWFHEARQADAALAPSFAETVTVARAKQLPAARWSLAWRFALGAVVLVAIGVAALVFFKRSTPQPNQQTAEQVEIPEPPPANVAPEITATVPAPVVKARAVALRVTPRRPRATRPRPEIEPAALLSFKWQSPTDFLLRTPGADLLKTVPRVNDSVVRFDIIRPDEQN